MEFFVVNHPLDGLRLALALDPPSRILLAGQSLTGASLLMQETVSCPAAGARTARWGSSQVTLLDPQGGPYADLLDHLRQRPGTTRAVLLYSRLEQDLPPLGAEDSLRCCWEVRDLLGPTTAASLDWLGRRVAGSQARNDGFCLYARRPLNDEAWQARRQQLAEMLADYPLCDQVELPALEVEV
jgi:hypothetical protein